MAQWTARPYNALRYSRSPPVGGEKCSPCGREASGNDLLAENGRETPEFHWLGGDSSPAASAD